MLQFQSAVIKDDDFTNDQKAKIAIRIAEADKKLVDGASEHLQVISATFACVDRALFFVSPQLLDVLSVTSTAINDEKKA
jgi:hypothetical protein